MLSSGGKGPGTDILFSGDASRWRKFANSLQLRYYMRISDAEPEIARAGIERIFGDPSKYPVFTSNDDDATFLFLPSQQPKNEYMSILFTNNRWDPRNVPAKTFVDIMVERSDPRLPVMVRPAKSSGNFVGLPSGLDHEEPNRNDYCTYGDYIFLGPEMGQGINAEVLEYSEVMFIKAEAAVKGWNVGPGAAQEFYEAGIVANIELWKKVDITKKFGTWGSTTEEYLKHPLVSWIGSVDHIKLIAAQRYISLYGTGGMEACSVYRRMDYPVLPEPPASHYPGNGLPFRWPYPSSEMSMNAENLSKASQGITDFAYGKKLWWDIK